MGATLLVRGWAPAARRPPAIVARLRLAQHARALRQSGSDASLIQCGPQRPRRRRCGPRASLPRPLQRGRATRHDAATREWQIGHDVLVVTTVVEEHARQKNGCKLHYVLKIYLHFTLRLLGSNPFTMSFLRLSANCWQTCCSCRCREPACLGKLIQRGSGKCVCKV
jgi:hypothetical protein